MTKATCSVDGCEIPTMGRGWCEGHYTRWRRWGDVRADLPLKPRRKPALCAVETCDREAAKRGWCHGHYHRWWRSTDIETPIRPQHVRGEQSYDWQGEAVGYSAVHMRLKTQQGPAKDHTCVCCGDPAANWAYKNNTSAHEQVEGGLRYSTALEDYLPMCALCHRRFDRGLLGDEPWRFNWLKLAR